MLVVPTLVVGYWLSIVLVAYPAFLVAAMRPHIILGTTEPIENITALALTEWRFYL